jgi:hypothetical protein
MYRKYLTKTVEHRFVENIPEIIEEGIIYITVIYGTAVHKCACGCGNEVVTPFSKSDWKLLFDGISVSLMPSLGIGTSTANRITGLLIVVSSELKQCLS